MPKNFYSNVKPFADFHTHTIYSDGKGTIEANVQAAINAGLEMIGITDHGPRNLGSGVDSWQTFQQIRQEIKEINEKYPEIKVLWGAETNVISLDGQIDVPSEILKDMDLVIVGLHPHVMPVSIDDGWHIFARNYLGKFNRKQREKSRISNTKAIVEAVHNYEVDIISHPGLFLAIDTEELAKACNKRQTAMEINVGHMHQGINFIQEAAEEGVYFVVDSDAHHPSKVGQLEDGIELLLKAEVSLDKILNVKLIT